MLIDAHAHVDRFEIVSEGALNQALAEIKERNIFTISNSMDLPSYERNIQIAEDCDYILPIFGIHPWNAPKCIQDVNKVRDFLSDKGVMGEIGLDHHFIKNEKEWEPQFTVFECIITLASFSSAIDSIDSKTVN